MATPYCLSFQDEAQAIEVLYTTVAEVTDADGNVIVQASVTPNYQNISILGIVYQPAPDPLPEGYVPIPYPAPNFGVNVLVLDDEDATPIEQYAVNPEPYAQRVWAGFN